MNDITQAPKAKKSVALSGVPAGNTAICTVGQSGKDLYYRGYSIENLANHATFEEVAYLLIYGNLPNRAELAEYKDKLKKLRGLPEKLRLTLETIPASAHPMDVLRTGASVLRYHLPEKEDHSIHGACDIADKLLASFPSMLLYWYHFTHNGRYIEVETEDDNIAAPFSTISCMASPPAELYAKLDTSLILTPT